MMQMKYLVIILVSIIIAIDPFIDNSNLICSPTAYLKPVGTVAFAYNTNSLLADQTTWLEKFSEPRSNFSILWTPFHNLQIGNQCVLFKQHKFIYGTNFKYIVNHETSSFPAVSLGIHFLGHETDTSPYLCFSKEVSQEMQLSMGLDKNK